MDTEYNRALNDQSTNPLKSEMVLAKNVKHAKNELVVLADTIHQFPKAAVFGEYYLKFAGLYSSIYQFLSIQVLQEIFKVQHFPFYEQF